MSSTGSGSLLTHLRSGSIPEYAQPATHSLYTGTVDHGKTSIFFLAHFSFVGVTIGSTFISAQHACGSYMPSYARRVREPLIMHATKFSNPKVDSYNLSEASHACWNEVTCFAHGKRDPRTLQAAIGAPPAHYLRTLRLPLCLVAWGAVACQTIGLRQEITVLLCIHLLRYLRDEVCRYHLLGIVQQSFLVCSLQLHTTLEAT